MTTLMETPVKTPQKRAGTENVLSTPLFVPPTPMLKELGYGTGMFLMNFFFFIWINCKPEELSICNFVHNFFVHLVFRRAYLSHWKITSYW